MTRLSALETFLNNFPDNQRTQLKKEILGARTSRQAYKHLQQLGYSASYDAVVNWRNSYFGSLPNDTLKAQADRVAQMASSESLRNDPVQRVMDLGRELNLLCGRVHGMLEHHVWIGEDGKLTNKDAFKLLAILPSLARAATGTTLEMHRIKIEMKQKAIALGVIHELREDWGKCLQSDNPELLPVFESVAAITLSRLELDKESLLEQAMQAGKLNSISENLPEK